MMKKILAALLAAVMVFSLAACSGKTEETTKAAETKAAETEAAKTEAETEAAAPAAEGKTKIVIYRTLYNRNAVDDAQVKKVEDAMNARLEELGSNVVIEIHEIHNSEYADKANLALANKEMNLLWNASWWGTIGTNDIWRANGAYDITDLLPGTTLWESMPEGYWEASKYDGKVLFIPVYKEGYEGYDMKAPKAVVDGCGWDGTFPEVTSKDNWYDRMAAFEPYLQAAVDNGTKYGYLSSQFFYRIALDEYDFFGGNSSLLAVDRETGEVVNAVDSESFRNWCKLNGKWAEMGLIHEDSISGSTPQGLGQTQDWALQFWTNVPGDNLKNSEERDQQEEYMIEGITDWYIHSTTTLGSCYTITASSSEEEAKACIEYLGYLYTDTALADLYTYGIEGEDYTIDENGRVHQNEDGKYNHSAWESTSIVPLTLLYSEPEDKVQSYEEKNLSAHTSLAAGFRFDITPVEDIWTACQNLNTEYGEPLEKGAYGPDEVDDAIDEYLAALDAAGYQTVLEEAKSQYAKWLETK